MSGVSQNLQFRQSQDLVMTPQLQQAIKLLQLNNIELSEFIEEELAQNPLLEKDEGKQNDADDFAAASSEDAAPDRKEDIINDDFDQVWTGNENETSAPEAPMPDFDAGSSMANTGAGGNHSFEDAENSFENRMSKETTLRDHLIEQLHMSFSDPRDRMIGTLLIEQIDEIGYLRAKPEELAARLQCAPERIDQLLAKMKQFDPTGIFARDLAECLSMQLDERGQLDAPMKLLLENLDLLAAYDHKKLASICGVNETYLHDMITEIRALNPRPASDFDHFVVQTAIPDVLMKRLPKNLGGGWRVELNSETLPKVLVNQMYYTEVSKHAHKKADKDYLNQQLQSANWIVKAMDQRAKTILKVASEIIEQQEGFFLYGIEYLRPMTLKDVAEVVDLHESTVSRVTNNKYIGTPRGIFELKYFFTTALGGENGDAHSAEAVKAKIKNMIEAESSDSVLSDDRLVEMLAESGIEIARRTVAKYREAMSIPSSVQRRRQKKHG